MFKFFLYKFGQFIVSRLPLGMAYRFAMFVSSLQHLISWRDRRLVYRNLRVILPQASQSELRRLTKEVFLNFGKYLVEFFRMSKDVDRAYIERMVTMENFDTFKRLHAEKKGVIMLTAHIGNWELGGVIMSLLGYESMAIALPHKERPVNDLFNTQREEKGVTIVPVNQAVRRCIETLKNNGIVALLADRDFNMSGEVIDFFGKKTVFPRGPAVFSYRTGAPIIPVFLHRKEDYTFHLKFEDPIYPPKEGDEQEILLTIMRKYVSIIEAKIRANPSQWLMFRQFWIDDQTP